MLYITAAVLFFIAVISVSSGRLPEASLLNSLKSIAVVSCRCPGAHATQAILFSSTTLLQTKFITLGGQMSFASLFFGLLLP